MHYVHNTVENHIYNHSFPLLVTELTPLTEVQL